MSEVVGSDTNNMVSFPSLKHVMSLRWREHAACADLPKGVFFDYNNIHLSNVSRKTQKELAVNTCNGCTVRGDCYEFSVLNNEPYGIWAGLVPDERKALYKDYLKTGVLTPLTN